MGLRSIYGNYRLTRWQRRLETSPLAFPQVLLDTTAILVCLPSGLRELTLVKEFLPELKSSFRSAAVALLAPPGVRINDIYPRKGYQILSPSADQTTWAGLPSKSYLQTLHDHKFDLVIDLTLGHSPFTRGVLLGHPQAVRVGKGNHLGRPYYNLEIKTKFLRDERNIYRTLVETLTSMKAIAARAAAASLN